MQEATWSALADPTRRALLEVLRVRPHAVGDLVDALRITQSATSKHLRVLRDVGLVRVLPNRQRRIYAIDPARFLELDEWLAPYRALWNDRLDALGEQLDNEILAKSDQELEEQ